MFIKKFCSYRFVDKNKSFSDIVGVLTILIKDFFCIEIFLRL